MLAKIGARVHRPCEQSEKHGCVAPMSLALIRSSPAVELNPEQQLAVEHGIGDAGGPGPLLVIAGAGSGKTAMLAHRVAALILGGADPKRIMLATFSRRAGDDEERPGPVGVANPVLDCELLFGVVRDVLRKGSPCPTG